MMHRRAVHSFRAVAACAAAFLLAFALNPSAAGAQSAPQPINTPSAAPSAQPAPQSDAGVSVSSVIHPGDTLSIGVYGDSTLPGTTIVQADGTIQYPLIGRVFVGGMSAAEARDAVAQKLKKFYKHPIVSLAVQQTGNINVTVLGNVKIPGKFQMRSGARLSDAIAAGGGIASISTQTPMARVQQLDGTMATANLTKLMREGDSTQNLPLEEGSYVYVTGGETVRVQVLGAVSRPGNVEVGEGDRLSMALARAGAETTTKPDLSKVYLTRTDPATGKTTSYKVNLLNGLEQGQQQYDPILQKDDKIWVPEARQLTPATIGVLGIIGRLLGF
ncbi:MAG TPA: polysaccharide biosynthesis/export family protein [Candidatus Elarobacter sp.]|jgi:protein involved in polysaccharide export with SLBB domain|nr:polysaccharide biosynthesis/export family protein [Candidatus Elarobacter sp.]